jgi:drug/metabolite transporter (DMT)-like permease
LQPTVQPEPRQPAVEAALVLLWRIPPGIRYMAAGAFFFSLMALLVKLVGQRIPNQEIVLARSVVTAAIAWFILRRSGVAPWGNDRVWLFLRGLIGYAALSALYFAYATLPLAEAVVLQSTTPVFVALIAAAWLRERLGPADLAVTVVSFLGVLLIARPGFLFGGGPIGLDPLGVGVALTGAVLAAVVYVMVRRLRATESPMVVVFYFGFISVLASAPLTAPVAVWPTPVEWLMLLGIGLTAYAAQVCLTNGLHLETAARATAVSYLQIVFAAVWGAIVFAERPDLVTFLGASLIVGGNLALVARRARGRTRVPVPKGDG